MNVAELLGPEGPVAKRLDRWEERPQQTELAVAIDRVMTSGGRLLAEAGTGVGKSFAYLVPAVIAAAERGERVVIATHTIALQEQLLGKDVPFLMGILPAEFSVVVAKGRGNFLCQRRLDLALGSKGELWDRRDYDRQLGQIVEWGALETHDGTRQELPFDPDWAVWSRVNAEAGNCLGRACDHYDACFYQAGRRRLQNANIIVANHHFLFADMALKQAGVNLLPEFQHLVLDEAHAVENVAGEFLGERVSRAQVHYLLRQLATPKGKGLLHAVRASDEALALVDEARAETELFFDQVADWIRSPRSGNRRLREPGQFPLDLARHLDDLGAAVRERAQSEEQKERRIELAARAQRCSALAGGLRGLVDMKHEDHVHWAEPDGAEGRNTTLQSAPVDVGAALEEQLWSKLRSATLTSATLSVGGRAGFGHLANRLGLERPEKLLVGSPFDYSRQARLVVDASVPDPRETESYENALPDAVLRHVRRTQGHAFVLFTSYQSLNRCHAACAGAMRAEGFVVFKQGEGLPRSQMIEQFRDTPNSVLFGTDSFWEGVDVPGDALRTVIIARLPFAVPTHPLQEARTQAIRDSGGEPFRDYALPQAILKLKQGFGRLIRSTQDTGFVVVLDQRIVKKRYGREFVRALPEGLIVDVIGG